MICIDHKILVLLKILKHFLRSMIDLYFLKMINFFH